MLAAFALSEADHVPVAPDLSAMVPVRLAGIPFDRAFLDGRPHYGYATATVAEAYVERRQVLSGWTAGTCTARCRRSAPKSGRAGT